jgi:acetate kinase
VRVLVVNAGSSSLKLRVLDGDDRLLARYDLEPGEPLPADLPDVDAVGHRVVHGGTAFVAPVVLDDEVTARLRELSVLAPLHQPASLAGIDAVATALPGLPAVACFDTTFHATMPEPATTYAVPREWRERWGVRRYGFHGLSHAYAARRAAEMVHARRTVTCHLGAGASLAAVLYGACVDTTMGFTPLEGLVMATRSGSVDPGLVLWLQEQAGLPAAEVRDALLHRSGLTALAGTGDVREVLAAARSGQDDARLALAVYVRSVCQHVAAMAVSLGGLDALVFTGGVGERSARVRADVVQGLALFGASLHEDAGDDAHGDRDVTAPGSGVRVLVVESREDLEIARGTRAALSSKEQTA